MQGDVKVENTNWATVFQGMTQDVNLNEHIGSIFTQIDRRNYTQCGLLMKDKRLGRAGFLMGSVIEGIIATQKESAETHRQMQTFLASSMQQLLAGQQRTFDQLIAITAGQKKFLQDFIGRIEEKWNQMCETPKMLFDLLKEGRREDFQTGIDAWKELLPHYKEMYKLTIESANKMLGNTMDTDKLLDQIIQSNQMIVMALKDSMEKMHQVNAETNRGTISQLGDIARAIYGAVKGNAAIDAPKPGSKPQIEILDEDTQNPGVVRALTAAPQLPPREYIGDFFKVRAPFDGNNQTFKKRQLKVTKGDQVRVFKTREAEDEGKTSDFTGWVKVEDANKKTGYIPGSYVKPM